MNLAPVAKSLVAAAGAVLTYILTLLAPTGTAAHIVTAVVLAGTVAGVWGVPNEITYAQARQAMRDQSAAVPPQVDTTGRHGAHTGDNP